jgi:hypothetical protein
MNDEFDPFDIENLRSPEAVAAEAALKADMEARKRNGDKPEWLKAKLAVKAKGGAQRTKREDLFTQIPNKAIVAGG